MKIAIIVLLELIYSFSLLSQVDEKVFESNFAPYGLSTTKLILKGDSTFLWKMKIEFGSRTFGGNWDMKSDTLFLFNSFINFADDPYNPGPDSIKSISQLSKYILKKDKLYNTINNKLVKKVDGYYSHFIYKITFRKKQYISHRYYLKMI
jgi:hypothetical protein